LDTPFLEWEDGPPLFKYIKSKILLGPLTFMTKVTPLPHIVYRSVITRRKLSQKESSVAWYDRRTATINIIVICSNHVSILYTAYEIQLRPAVRCNDDDNKNLQAVTPLCGGGWLVPTRHPSSSPHFTVMSPRRC